MLLKDLRTADLARRLPTSGVTLDTGSFRTHLTTDLPEFAQQVRDLYGGFPVEVDETISDFSVRISPTSLLRRVVRPSVRAYIDDEDPFDPMSRDLALPLFESTLNWCIASRVSRFYLLHAASVSKDGRAVILPAPSGSGKSTLCAWLTFNGWRLLSDEFAIVRVDDGRLQANPRPISLKNESIERISEAAGADRLSKRFDGTVKGTIAYLRPDDRSLAAAGRLSTPVAVVFPTFEHQADLHLKKVEESEAFMRIVNNSVNYLTHGRDGFETVARLVESCKTYELRYSRSDEALAAINELCASASE